MLKSVLFYIYVQTFDHLTFEAELEEQENAVDKQITEALQPHAPEDPANRKSAAGSPQPTQDNSRDAEKDAEYVPEPLISANDTHDQQPGDTPPASSPKESPHELSAGFGPDPSSADAAQNKENDPRNMMEIQDVRTPGLAKRGLDEVSQIIWIILLLK